MLSKVKLLSLNEELANFDNSVLSIMYIICGITKKHDRSLDRVNFFVDCVSVIFY